VPYPDHADFRRSARSAWCRSLEVEIVFGEPMPIGTATAPARRDEVLVPALNEKLRATIQDTLDRALRQRRGSFGLMIPRGVRNGASDGRPCFEARRLERR